MRNILGDYQLFQDGIGFVSLVEEVKLPDLKWKVEDYMGGGLMGTRSLKTILDKMEVSVKAVGFEPKGLAAWGQMPGVTQNYKLMSSMIVPGEGEVPQKVLFTGALFEVKRDAYKAGGKVMTELMVTDVLFYEEWFDGRMRLQVDLLNQVLMVDGIDLMAARRRNTGRL